MVRLFERGPEMMHGIRAPRPPALGRRDVRAMGRQGLQDSGVRRREGVGIGQRAHPDVGDGPRPDARQRQQSRRRLVAVGARVQGDLARGERRSQGHQRPSPGRGHGQRRRVRRGDRRRVREAVRQRAARPCEWLAVFRGQPAAEPPGGGDGHLLAEDGAHRELVAVDVAGRPPSRAGKRQRAHYLVRRQEPRDGLRIGVQVEQAPAALHGRRDIAQVV